MTGNKDPKVSIIIPLYDVRERFFQDFLKFDLLSYSNYEILVVSDIKVKLPQLHKCKVKLVTTRKAKTGPAEKRDIALTYAKGSICAFIDDDAYPDKNWINNAIKYFNNDNNIAVGGPGITPKEDGYWEKISGMVYESFFCSGGALYRFVPQPAREVEDYPAYNLFVKKSILKKVGGYGTFYYGGEDTFLCLKLIKFGKIYYDPNVLVYHHRRKLFFGLLKQISNIGKHRGYFSKIFPETSRKPMYFFPSLLTLGFLSSMVLMFIVKVNIIFFILIIISPVIAGAISVKDNVGVRNKLLVGLGILMVHLTYGIFFILGLLTNNLRR